MKDFFFFPAFPISAIILLMFGFIYLGIDGIIWARRQNKEILLIKSKLGPKWKGEINKVEKGGIT